MRRSLRRERPVYIKTVLRPYPGFVIITLLYFVHYPSGRYTPTDIRDYYVPLSFIVLYERGRAIIPISAAPIQ